MAIPNIESKLAPFMSNRRQELIILPTEKCNFRCTYCYEDYTIGRMSDDTIGGVKAFLDRRTPELDELYLSWFGGEPLVAKDIVFDISDHASALAKAHSGLRYRGSMTTNAYFLTPSTLSQLTAVEVLDYQITLDGPREMHNCSRLRADGKGTFDRIWENLLAGAYLIRPHYLFLHKFHSHALAHFRKGYLALDLSVPVSLSFAETVPITTPYPLVKGINISSNNNLFFGIFYIQVIMRLIDRALLTHLMRIYVLKLY